MLGGKSGSEQLRDWAMRELQGYSGTDDLPDYRIIAAPLQLDGTSGHYQVTGQQLSAASLPDFAQEHITEKVELRDGLGSIEALLQQPEIKLMPPGGSGLATYMNMQNDNSYQHIDRIYWAVSPASIRGALDQVRTALTQFVAELRANMSHDEDLPSTDAVNQAVNVVVTGKRSRVSVAAAQASGSNTTATTGPADPAASQPNEEGFWTRSRQIGAFIVGLASIAAAVAAVIEVL